jgi:hypothetical protein
MSDDPNLLPPSPIPRVTPPRARGIARGLKRLADEYAENGMHHEADAMTRGSEWWLAYAVTLENEARTTTLRPRIQPRINPQFVPTEDRRR